MRTPLVDTLGRRGRSRKIRTSGPSLPKRVLCQAELYSVKRRFPLPADPARTLWWSGAFGPGAGSRTRTRDFPLQKEGFTSKLYQQILLDYIVPMIALASPNTSPRSWTDRELQRAIQLLECYTPLAKIAEELDRTERSVYNKLRKAGYKRSAYSKTQINCLECGVTVRTYRSSPRKFCSQSCAAKTNNRLSPKRAAELHGRCQNCSASLRRKGKFCSNACQQDWYLQERVSSGSYSSQTAKRWLLRRRGPCCEGCKLPTWQGKPIPLELDHIDGNAENNQLPNLRLLCPNCHAQTPTYKGKNRGQGRHVRRERYASGKSH